jgi:hypothetical protein
MVTLHDDFIGDIDRINARGEALLRAVSELEKVLRSYGRDRRAVTLIVTETLFDGLPDGEQTAAE